ncbi:hypothetical protein IJJ39_01950 [Candidatus Saccharibacteria bacterium]|nr:hypothetical protein [Candidatus Saccharibacteria bacterium]
MEKAGRIYLTIAEKALEEWYPDMPMSERTLLLSRGNFRELEGLLGMKSSIENACFYIKENLNEFPTLFNLADVVLYSASPKRDLADVIDRIRISQFFATGKAELALKAAAGVHDNWVLENADKFFDRSRVMFLRIELLGLDEVMKYMILIKPILETLELAPDKEHLRSVYRDERIKFRNFYGIKDRQGLIDYIRRADYPPLSGSIAAAMSDKTTARAIAKQVVDLIGDPSHW